MHNYPNPLNIKLSLFKEKRMIVAKKDVVERAGAIALASHEIIREDIYGNSFHFYAVSPLPAAEAPALIHDVFRACKARQPKDRTPSAPMIPSPSPSR